MQPSPKDYLKFGFALVPVHPKSKKPVGTNWQINPITKPESLYLLNRKNVGLLHTASGTGALDIDNFDLTTKALSHIGIPLSDVLKLQGPKVMSNGIPKPIYQLPNHINRVSKKLVFNNQTKGNKNNTDSETEDKSITVFEIRVTGQDLLPPSIHPNGHTYTWSELPKTKEDIPEIPETLLWLYEHWDELEPLMQEVSPWYEPPKVHERKSSSSQIDDVIGQYNQRVSIQAVLEGNGYQQAGDRYLSPSSSSKIPGVAILQSKLCYSHHASDLLNDGHAHDAFDVMRILECNGELKQALDKAREVLGLEPFKPDAKSKKQAKHEKRKERKPNLVFIDKVEREEVSFLWHPYIPLGKLTLLEGDPGLGKTFIALTLCSIVTNGHPFPNASGEALAFSPNPLGASNVIYLTAEDGLGDTLKPRLENAKADCSKVAVLQGFTEIYDAEEVQRVFTLSDVDMLEEALQLTQAKLVVIDPIQGFLGSDVDMHRANEVRPILSGLGKLADTYKCAVLGIRHLSKANKTGALHRGLGSVDFTAFARSQLLVGKHNEQRLIAHSKSSLAPEGKSLAYDIQDGQLVWSGLSDLTPDDVASTYIHKSEDESEADKIEQAKAIIRLALDETPTPSSAIYSEASQLGISKRTVERAKEDLGNIKATPLRLPKDPTKNVWHWHYQHQIISISQQGDIEINGEPLPTPQTAQKSDKPLREQSMAVMADMEENASETAKTLVYPRPPHGGVEQNMKKPVQDTKTVNTANTAITTTLRAIVENNALSFEDLMNDTEPILRREVLG